MSKFIIDALNPREELMAVLDYNAVSYRKEADGSVRTLFSENRCKWETVFRFSHRTVLIYGIYPFFVSQNIDTALMSINAVLTRGAMFRSGSALVMRTSAELFDAYGSYEAIALAIEYNANAITRFWAELNRLSADNG